MTETRKVFYRKRAAPRATRETLSGLDWRVQCEMWGIARQNELSAARVSVIMFALVPLLIFVRHVHVRSNSTFFVAPRVSKIFGFGRRDGRPGSLRCRRTNSAASRVHAHCRAHRDSGAAASRCYRAGFSRSVEQK